MSFHPLHEADEHSLNTSRTAALARVDRAPFSYALFCNQASLGLTSRTVDCFTSKYGW